MTIEDWELWACAQAVIKEHGEKAPAHVSEQIGALAVENDEAGVEVWRAIAERIDMLMDYRTGRPLRKQ